MICKDVMDMDKVLNIEIINIDKDVISKVSKVKVILNFDITNIDRDEIINLFLFDLVKNHNVIDTNNNYNEDVAQVKHIV